MESAEAILRAHAPGYTGAIFAPIVNDRVVRRSDTPDSVPEKKLKGPKGEKKVRDPRGRNWCFTEYDLTLDYFRGSNRDKIRYLRRQREVCPNTSREHYQGWLQLSEHQTLRWMKKNISETAHFESCKGSEEANEKYCSKLLSQSSPSETYGEYKKQGSGCVSSEELASLVLDGRSLTEIGRMAPGMMCYHSQKVLAYRLLMNPPKTRRFEKILFLYGEPGSDKSPFADRLYPDAYTMHDSPQGWADGYDNESVIIIDEFTGQYPLPLLLQLCDTNKLRLPVKGGFVPCCVTTVVFIGYTLHPRLYYNGDPAWMKRLNKYGTIMRMKPDKTNWRQVEELDYDESMEPKAILPKVVAEGRTELASPEGSVLPKQVRGAGSLSPQLPTKSTESTMDDRKAVGGYVDLNRVFTDLNARKIAAFRILAEGMYGDGDGDEKVPPPPPLVRQNAMRTGRRNAISVEDVLSKFAPQTISYEKDNNYLAADYQDATDTPDGARGETLSDSECIENLDENDASTMSE